MFSNGIVCLGAPVPTAVVAGSQVARRLVKIPFPMRRGEAAFSERRRWQSQPPGECLWRRPLKELVSGLGYISCLFGNGIGNDVNSSCLTVNSVSQVTYNLNIFF